MKKLTTLVQIGLATGCLLGAPKAQATLEVGVSVRINAKADFDAPLRSHGVWLNVASYGQCWRPSGVALSWRPYCDGRWIWTDCGWYWESDEPWAWACYHYGRWVYDSEVGWVWVPGIEWAPAWVYWRVGGGYVGWAPCPPAGVLVEPTLFAFVEVRHFRDPVRPRTVVVNNPTIVNKTTVINNIQKETRTIDGNARKVFVNEGPGVEPFEKAGHTKVSAIPIQQAARRTPVPSTMTQPKEKSVGKEIIPKTPAGTAPQESLKKESPATMPAQPSPGSVAPHNAHPSQATPAPGERHHKPHYRSHDHSKQALDTAPVKPAEPGTEKGDQAHPSEKPPTDKEKP